MVQHNIECETCHTKYILVTQDEDNPVYCSFCASAFSSDDDEDEGDE